MLYFVKDKLGHNGFTLDLFIFWEGLFLLSISLFVSFFNHVWAWIFQMLSHRLFPQSEYSIWVDSKSQFRRDPLGVLEALLWRTNSVLAISEHGARSSVYDEAKAVVKKNKAKPEEVAVQLNQYKRDGLPEDKRFNGKKGMQCIKLHSLYSY
jgi:hypothetical protein